MTCIVGATLVEVCSAYGVVELRPAHQLRVGDVLHARHPTTVRHILSQRIRGWWPIVSYMGVDADSAQWVALPSGRWERVSNVAAPVLMRCDSIYGFVVDGGRVMRAGGVDCYAYATYRGPSSAPSSAPSPASDEEGDDGDGG